MRLCPRRRGHGQVRPMAQWTTAYINDLPDSAFLYIESGGEKDDEGKTVPRSLRHFPVKDADGKVDLPHLRNAIAQAPKADLPADVIEKVQAKARKLLDEKSERTSAATTIADGVVALSVVISNKTPPSEFRIFKRGANETTKGTFVYNAQSEGDVLSRLKKDGRTRLPIDYGHGMLAENPSPDNGRAAGWFTPEARNGELWATNIEWTAIADSMIRGGEYAHMSPAFGHDVKTRRIVRLVNVALTNLPATIGQEPIAAHDNETHTPGMGETETNMAQKLFESLGAKDEAEAIVIVAEHSRWTRGILSALGATSLDGASKALDELKGEASKVEKLTEQASHAVELADTVRKLEAEKAERDKADAERKQGELIAKLSEEGKLPPALHEWAKSLSYEQLSSFGEVAGVVAPKQSTQHKSNPVQLTDEEKRTAKMLNIPLASIEATKKAAVDAVEEG